MSLKRKKGGGGIKRKERKKARTKLLWTFKKSSIQTQPPLETLLLTSGPRQNHTFVKKGRERKRGGILFPSITEETCIWH